MDFRSLKFVADACAGEQLSGSVQTVVNHVCSDSRQAQAGDLFFALKGERFDGHDFLSKVAEKGVAAMVVERSKAPARVDCAVITVDDPRKALGRLAARYRTGFKLPVVAVVGSNGKTTTKELLAGVLRQKLETLWSEASFNNDIGVPMTLLKLEEKYQAAVLEVGTNHPGELAPLVRMIQPDIGIITSIGREHLEFFGDLDGVAEEEGRLAELLPQGGKLFVNGDDEWCLKIAQRTQAKVLRVGFDAKNDWRAGGIGVEGRIVCFQVETDRTGHAGGYRINLVGRHQVLNSLFAIAVGAELGLARTEIQKGLDEAKAAKMRLQLWEWEGVRVLDDTYNANADSMMAALQTLRELPCDGRRIAVLGDMAELGAHTQAAHEEVGRLTAELGIDVLFAVGTMSRITADAARLAGTKHVAGFNDVEVAALAVKEFLRSGDAILLKASRSMRLERLVDMLRAAKEI